VRMAKRGDGVVFGFGDVQEGVWGGHVFCEQIALLKPRFIWWRRGIEETVGEEA
jgi:hypothetical protein